jgi:hypothetical protein
MVEDRATDRPSYPGPIQPDRVPRRPGLLVPLFNERDISKLLLWLIRGRVDAVSVRERRSASPAYAGGDRTPGRCLGGSGHERDWAW